MAEFGKEKYHKKSEIILKPILCLLMAEFGKEKYHKKIRNNSKTNSLSPKSLARKNIKNKK